MRTSVFRISALVVSSAALAMAAACSSSSSNNNSGGSDGGNDAGGDVTTMGDSGGTEDSGTDSSTGPGMDSGGGSDTGSNGDSSQGQDSGSSDAPSGDGSDGGPGFITLQFDPNGTGSPDAIYWDDTKQILYIVDDMNNQVWTYTDAAGFAKYVQVPDNPALDDAGKTKLNGITELSDGTLVVTRFGYGIGGALYTVSPDGGATTTVPNVPTSRKRIEVTVDPSTGTIYSDSFSGGGGSAISGQVETVDLTSGTTAYATGFGKTVGLLVQGSVILVSDQSNNAILAVPTDPTQLAEGGAGLADGAAFPVYASITGPDQLSAGPNGTIFTDEFLSGADGGSPQVRQIAPDGGVTIPWPNVTFTSLSDVAYDSTNHRLFVVDSNGTTVRTIKIFPVQ